MITDGEPTRDNSYDSLIRSELGLSSTDRFDGSYLAGVAGRPKLGRDAPRAAAPARQGRRRAARQGVARERALAGAAFRITGARRHRLAGAAHAVLSQKNELAGRRARAPAAVGDRSRRRRIE